MILVAWVGCLPAFPDPHALPPTGATGTDTDLRSDTADTANTADTGDPPGLDQDGDGVSPPEDCDDADPEVYPGALETCGDAVDRDCDGEAPGCVLSGILSDVTAIGGAGSAGTGAKLSRAGAVWPGADGVAVGIGSSARALRGDDPSEGDDATILASVGGKVLATRVIFPGDLAKQHSGIHGVGDLDGDQVDEFLAVSWCYLPEMGNAPDCPFDAKDPDGSTAILVSGGVSGGTLDLAMPSAHLRFLDSIAGRCPGSAAVPLDPGRWAVSGACAEGDLGRVWILDGIPAVSDIDAAASGVLTGDLAHHASGWTLSSGDVIDGDGTADLVLGTYGGNGTGMSALVVESANLTGVLDLYSANRTWTSGRDPEPHTVGTQVEASTDLDGDGISDVLVGLTGDGGGGGSVFLLQGEYGSSGSIQGAARAVLEGGTEGSFGAALSAGDVDHDGWADLVVGAPDANGGLGQAWLVPGEVLGAGGTFDVTTTATATFGGTEVGARLGITALLPGDVDGDGWGDLVLGREDASDDPALLFLGGPTAL